MDFTVLVGGAAGQGIETVVLMLEKAIKRCGYEVFTYKNYMSMVRGGHNFMQVRFSDENLSTYSSKVDLIFAMTDETIELHKERLSKGGLILADDGSESSVDVLKLRLKKAANEAGNPRSFPTVGFGAVVKHCGIDFAIAESVVKESFKKELQEVNLKAFVSGYELMEEPVKMTLKEDKNIIINGNNAIALGAIAAGCKYYCGYPMTPSTSVMTYISSKATEMEIVVDQIEDEVGALNMALGASFAGVRAMTGTSGGGFALMTEALSLAGIIELPVVILNAQRPGPATGLSTRSEQGDLRFVIHAGHGEFPKMVITLRNPEDAFYQTARAFNIADKYQIPVILMTEEYLADYMTTTEPFDFSKIKVERHLADESDIEDEKYLRYKLTESGISPRLIPGRSGDKIILADSHEHDESGKIEESIENRNAMMKKRMKKFELLKSEVEEPWIIGKPDADDLLVAFGATWGAVKDAVDRINATGGSAGAVIYGDIWPFPTKALTDMGERAKRIIVVEQNYTGQLESLIKEHTRLEIYGNIRKYDGRAINGDEIIAEYLRIKGIVD
ncbi:MAG: 2-oxoacid:acceptor oxidoreductase subunit alpha [Gudongella sp.]|jgi:2-oxoglutarate ferredoxin oxidoreductase subunit alpha|nr:2-oxoacid:acceptor oxidoreductase subunit alpha [Gudongella sp.]